MRKLCFWTYVTWELHIIVEIKIPKFTTDSASRTMVCVFGKLFVILKVKEIKFNDRRTCFENVKFENVNSKNNRESLCRQSACCNRCPYFI